LRDLKQLEEFSTIDEAMLIGVEKKRSGSGRLMPLCKKYRK
jgi:hypothetical protein